MPDSEHLEFNTVADAAMALSSGKVDAFSTENAVYCAMLWEGMSFSRVEEAIVSGDYGYIFNKGENTELRGKLDDFIIKLKGSGELETLQKKWFSSQEPSEFTDYETLTGENGTVRVAISSEQKPFAYIHDGKFAGFDVELLTAFAKEYGYSLEFSDASFDGILSGINKPPSSDKPFNIACEALTRIELFLVLL